MKPIVKVILAFLAAYFLWSYFLKPKDGEIDIRRMLRKGALLVDVRSPGEYASGHIEGAINIEHNRIAQEIGQHESDLGDAIILYCHSGIRSSVAKKTLNKAGYTNVVNAGGLYQMNRALQ